MNYARAAFQVGMTFESNTEYYGEKTIYHVYPQDAVGGIHCWYTLVTPQDPPLVAGFVLRGLENVTIDLGGATLLFHGRILPFALYNCKNVTLRNFAIDYDRPFYTQGTITDVDQGMVTLDIPEAFRYRAQNGELIAESEYWTRSLNFGAPLFQPYDAATQRISSETPFFLGVIGEQVTPQENPPCPIYQLRAEQLSGRQVRLTGTPDFFLPRVGEVLAFTHENRHKTGFQMEQCADVVLEDIRLLHISALAVVACLCHNLTFRRFGCYSDERSNGRIISVNADVLHGFHCSGEILVEDCRFENMLDDALNFHGNYNLCQQALDKHSFIAYSRAAALGDMPTYLPGDLINVYRGSTQELKAVYTVEEAQYLPGDARRQTLRVRESLSDFAPGDIIESRRMPAMTIRRCASGRARGGWRISTGKKVRIEDCRFEHTHIMFTGDTNYWFENSPVRDVEIRNCVFEHFPGSCISATPVFEPTDRAPFYHSGIRVIGNQFIDCSGDLMHMSRTDDIEFRGNTLLDSDSGASHQVVLRDCGKVSMSR